MANSILGSILGDFKSRYGHQPELTLLPFGLESCDMFLFISIPSNLSKFPTPPSEEPYVNCIPSTIFYLKKRKQKKNNNIKTNHEVDVVQIHLLARVYTLKIKKTRPLNRHCQAQMIFRERLLPLTIYFYIDLLC